MTTPRRIAASILFFAATLSLTQAPAQTKPGHLQEVLRQMDVASTHFKSAQADFRWDIYERVVRQTTTQNGSIYFLKNGTKTQMGAKILPPFTKFLEYKNGQLRIYDPGPNQLTILNAGANQAQYESFLTLGFGGGGTELAKAWTISDLGTESINDGSGPVETVKLDLVSKEQKVRDMFTHITIWVDPRRGISLKQQFFTPSDDQKTATYLHIRYNQKVDTAPFAIKTNKKTAITQH
ncbi:MAG: outer membrane lipoprotein-sorting protein [Edaphobacter sp.]